MQNDENLYHFCLVELPQPTTFSIIAPLPPFMEIYHNLLVCVWQK